jgi:drug/metabolite transporter (DMT)-like permease
VLVIAILFAMGSAACIGLSSALQQRAAKQERPRRALDPRLLISLLHRPLWLFGWVPDLVGTVLQALALRFGPLTLVQPLLASGLFLAIPIEAAMARTRPHSRDLIAGGLGLVGLTAFLATVQPTAGVADPSVVAWLGVGAAAGAVVAVCLILAARTTNAARGGLLGVATGLFYALLASLLKPLTTTLTDHPAAIFGDWHLYALIPVAIGGLLLTQNAFQSGRLAAPLTALTLVDPATSVLIGVLAFEEKLSLGGWRIIPAAAGVALMVTGIWLAGTRRHLGAVAGH